MNSQPLVEIKSYSAESMMNIKSWKSVCLQAAAQKEVPKFEPLEFVVEFEEKELRELQDPESDLYKFFLQRFQRIANAAKVNMFIFIGHSDICLDYVDLISEKVERGELVIPNSYPSVILVIGCMGLEYLEAYRKGKNGKYRYLHAKKFHFFGFNNLVHIYKGKIFNCEQPHLALPKQRCGHLPKEKQEECCDAKQGSFHRLFLEYLNKRDCTEITDEAFIDRFRSIGSPTFKGYLFGSLDGKRCEQSNPCVTPSENQMTSNQKSKEFNSLYVDYDPAWLQLYRQIDNLSEQKIITLFKNLPKEKLPLLNHVYSKKKSGNSNTNTIYFDSTNNTFLVKSLDPEKYELAMYLLTQTRTPVSFRYSDLYKEIGNIISARIKDDEFFNPDIYNDDYQIGYYLHAWQEYNYFVIAFQKDPTFFTTFFDNPDYPELQTTLFYEILISIVNGFTMMFTYKYLREKLPLNDNGYIDLPKLNTEQDHGDVTNFKFTKERRDYWHILWCLVMKIDPNMSWIHKEINFFLNDEFSEIDESGDERYDLLRALLAYGYKMQSVLETIRTLYRRASLYPNTNTNTTNVSKKNRLVKKRLETLLQLVPGSEHFSVKAQQKVKQHVENFFERFIVTLEEKHKYTQNLPARRQFPSMMAQLSQVIKKLPVSEREKAYSYANAVLQNGQDPEHVRLENLKEYIDSFKPTPAPNTTLKAKPKKARGLNPENTNNNNNNTPSEPPTRRSVLNPENNNNNTPPEPPVRRRVLNPENSNQEGGKRRKTRKQKK